MKKLLLLVVLAVLALAVYGLFFALDDVPDYSSLTSSASADKVYVNLEEQGIRMFLNDENGNPYGDFASVIADVEAQGERVVFATNGGMFHEDGTPVGLFVERGQERSPLNTKQGEGSFFIQPNGVFYVSDLGAGVVTTDDYPPKPDAVMYATQSGPMLVENGKINSAFDPQSDDYEVRSGVCALSNVDVMFIVSNDEMTFYDFASLFKNEGCKNALYLDGIISRIYDPDIGFDRTDGSFGPIIAAIAY